MGCKRSEVQILSPRLVGLAPHETVISDRYGGVFMPQTKTQEKWLLGSVELRDAYTDFMLSRQAMNCTPSTLAFYHFTVGKFLEWIEQHGVTRPEEVTARYVREHIAELVSRGKKDTTVWDHARAIKTMLVFWLGEGYMPTLVRFELPKLAKKRLPVLTAEQLKQLIRACDVREKALVLFMADSGLRRSEVSTLNWADIKPNSQPSRKQRRGGALTLERMPGHTRENHVLDRLGGLDDRHDEAEAKRRARACFIHAS